MNHFDAVAQYRTSMDDELARRFVRLYTDFNSHSDNVLHVSDTDCRSRACRLHQLHAEEALKRPKNVV